MFYAYSIIVLMVIHMYLDMVYKVLVSLAPVNNGMCVRYSPSTTGEKHIVTDLDFFTF